VDAAVPRAALRRRRGDRPAGARDEPRPARAPLQLRVLRDARRRRGRRSLPTPPPQRRALPALPPPGARGRRPGVRARGPAVRGGAPVTVQVATFDQLEAIPFEDGFVWHPVRRRFGLRAFGTNAYTAEAVGRQIV